MATPLPATVTIQYNGVALGAMTQTAGLRITPVESRDGRTVTHSVYAFTFKTRISSATTAAQTLNLRRKILENGKPFRYLDAGLDLEVNVGSVKDVTWGPKTREVAFRPLGGGVACELVWSLETAIPSCALAKFQFALMAFSFAATYDVDRLGYTTRRLAGELMIPQTRGPGEGRQLLDSPDYYRERINPDLLAGFRRAYGPWVVSDDRQRLTFEIVDEEMGKNIPPAGVIDVQASHAVRSVALSGNACWAGTLNASYTLGKSASGIVAASHFFKTLVADRVKATGRELGKDSGAVVPVAIELSEPSIYGRENLANFTLTYTFPRELKDGILKASALWRPVPDSNWRLWAASLANTALHPRGGAKLVFDVGDDPGIVDLCRAGVTELRTVRGPDPDSLPYGPSPVGVARPVNVSELIRETFPPPRAAASWLDYWQDIQLEVDNGTVPVSTLPTKPLTADDDVFGSADDLAGPALDANKAFGARMPADVLQNVGGRIENETVGGVQRRAKATAFVHLVGRAARAAHPIPCPRLLDAGGLKPVPANRIDRGEGFRQSVWLAGGVFPIYTASWRLRYQLPELPKKPIAVPPNPMRGG